MLKKWSTLEGTNMDCASTPLVDFCVFKERLIMKSRASSIVWNKWSDWNFKNINLFYYAENYVKAVFNISST